MSPRFYIIVSKEFIRKEPISKGFINILYDKKKYITLLLL